MRNDSHSVIAWVIIAVQAIGLEIYLLIARSHTLSEQMRYWIRHGKLGSVLVMFWTWLLYHFVIEPVIRFVSKFLSR